MLIWSFIHFKVIVPQTVSRVFSFFIISFNYFLLKSLSRSQQAPLRHNAGEHSSNLGKQ
ncbi:hypothetical protein ACRRTK_012617 [Alexandromys fortis]